MKNKIKFSLVIPVYGVEKFLERCLQSIVEQSYQNFEVIIVNDCSPDSSEKIARYYCKKYDNFLYYENLKNLGLSLTRNEGFRHVSGDYVLFLDSDDYFDKNLLLKIYESLEYNDADVVLYGLIEEYRDSEENIIFTKTHNYISMFFNNINFRKHVIDLESETLYGYAWNKAYKVSVLKENKILFERITHIEDIKFNIQVFNSISSLNILNDVLYHYDQHNSDRLTSKHIPDYFELQKERINLILNQLTSWGVYDKRSQSILANVYHRSFLSALQRQVVENKSIGDFLKNEYQTSMFSEFYRKSCAKNKISKILYFIIDTKNIILNIFLAKSIAMIKDKNNDLFSKMKQQR